MPTASAKVLMYAVWRLQQSMVGRAGSAGRWPRRGKGNNTAEKVTHIAVHMRDDAFWPKTMPFGGFTFDGGSAAMIHGDEVEIQTASPRLQGVQRRGSCVLQENGPGGTKPQPLDTG